jgi:hypothetical protein
LIDVALQNRWKKFVSRHCARILFSENIADNVVNVERTTRVSSQPFRLLEERRSETCRTRLFPISPVS